MKSSRFKSIPSIIISSKKHLLGLSAVFGGLIVLYFILNLSSSRTFSASDSTVRKLQFTYSVKVKNLPKASQELLLLLPIPQSDRNQEISSLKIKSDFPYTVYTEPEYGNSILKLQLNKDIPQELDVRLDFISRRRAVKPGENFLSQTDKISREVTKRYLSPDRLVPIDGIIALEADKVVEEGMSDMQKARAIYDYIVSNLKYDKSGTGWGRGDALYACDARRGNCSDFHSLFIGMSRATGIPARFVMGFPVPESQTEEIKGYHCWAEFYIEDLGWVPVDASEANKNPDKKEFFFGGLDANRVAFTVGRDIQIDPTDSSLSRNFFIYPYVSVDGKPYTDVELQVKYTDLTVRKSRNI